MGVKCTTAHNGFGIKIAVTVNNKNGNKRAATPFAECDNF